MQTRSQTLSALFTAIYEIAHRPKPWPAKHAVFRRTHKRCASGCAEGGCTEVFSATLALPADSKTVVLP